MPERESAPAAAPAVTNLTMNFNAPVGTLAQANAPGAQAAGRDIVIGLHGAELLPILAAVQRAIDGCTTQPEDAEQRRLMAEELDEVRTVLQGEGRSVSDAKLVKPMPHEQRKQLLLRRCFAELAADVRRQEYIDTLGLKEPDRSSEPAACIRRRARSSAC